MRQRAWQCAAILMLWAAGACSSDVEEVYGSMEGVDARVAGVRTGTKLTLVGERTGALSEDSVTNKWVRFKVPDRSRARVDAPDQCLSIVQGDGTPLAMGKTGASFRHDVWMRAAALEDEEADLRKSAAALQAEIDRAETGRRNAAQWLGRNGDVYVGGRCEKLPEEAKPATACAPDEETAFAQRRCKEAVIDCAVIAMTMGKTGTEMFDSTFMGSQVAQACGVQTATVVGDDYGISAGLAAAMKSPAVKSAAESLASDPRNPMMLDQFAQAVLTQQDFAECQPRASQTCASEFDKWQSDAAQRLRRCQNTRQAQSSARDKIAQINQRRDEIERQLVPIRRELLILRTSGAVALQAGCESASPVVTLRPATGESSSTERPRGMR